MEDPSSIDRVRENAPKRFGRRGRNSKVWNLEIFMNLQLR